MKQEFLKGLGLDDEIINKIQAESGKDITTLKTTIVNLQEEIGVKDGIIETKNGKITELEKIDIEKIKGEEYERGKTDGSFELEKFKFASAVEAELSKSGTKNVKALKALLDMEKVKIEDDKIVGLTEQLEQIKTDNDYLFEASSPPPKFSDKSNPGGSSDVTKEVFAKMGYAERTNLFSENPELYKELKGGNE